MYKTLRPSLLGEASRGFGFEAVEDVLAAFADLSDDALVQHLAIQQAMGPTHAAEAGEMETRRGSVEPQNLGEGQRKGSQSEMGADTGDFWVTAKNGCRNLDFVILYMPGVDDFL